MPRMYAACLASYNNGTLHGRWIDLDQDADAVYGEIAAMLRLSPHPNVTVACPLSDDPLDTVEVCGTCGSIGAHGRVRSAEEWAAHDYDDVPGSWGEFPDIAKLCEFAKLYEEHGESYAAFVDNFGETDEDSYRDRYSGEWRSAEEWAEDYIESTGQLESNSTLANYFDYERYARDVQRGGDMTFVDGGRGVFAFNNH